MANESEIIDIFSSITERYEQALRLSKSCESNTYYRVEDLKERELQLCAEYLSERIVKVCYPNQPEILISLKSNFTELAEKLANELAPYGESLEVLELEKVEAGNGIRQILKGRPVVLVNDVITTGKSCLEAHNTITMMGGVVMCWVALIDRTFGPGPVPVVAALTGDPITLVA